MGWLFCKPSRADLIEHLKFKLTRPGFFDHGSVLASEISVTGNTLYALLRLSAEYTAANPTSPTKVILVYALKGAPERPGDPHAWGYKDMDESMGPNVTTCPKKLLALSDCQDSYAPAWRQLCHDWHAKKQETAKMKPGIYKMTTEPAYQKDWLDTHFPNRLMRFGHDGYWHTMTGYRVRGARRGWGAKYAPEWVSA